jgi:polysaccharide biosynthesis transport protein
MDLRQQLRVVRHWLWLIVLSVVLAASASYLISSALPKVYEGQVTLIVGQSLSAADPDYQGLLASQRLSQTYAQVATTRPILATVNEQLGLGLPPEELRQNLSAQAARDSTLLTVTASHGDPDTAAAIANAVASELLRTSPAIQGQQETVGQFVDEQLASTQLQIENVQADIDALLAVSDRTAVQESQLESQQARLTALRQTYSQLLAYHSSSGANLLTIVDPASPAAQPSSPRVLLNTMLAAALGLLVALGLAFLIEHLDDTIKSPDDVGEVIGAPTLGVVMQMKLDKKQSDRQRLVTLAAPRSPVAEAFRTLRTNLEFASVDKQLRSLVVTSAVPGEGKSTVSANVALTFAQAGRKVVLLDADMRRPSIHRLFEVPNSYGLTTLLRSEETPIGSIAHATDELNLRVITTGPLPPNPAELLGSQRMGDLMARLDHEADMIVVDSPPLHAVTDAAVLAAQMDGALLVVHAGRTKRGAVRQAKEALERVGANILGVTLNRLTERTTAAYYYRYYGDYYAAGSGSSSPEASAVNPTQSARSR